LLRERSDEVLTWQTPWEVLHVGSLVIRDHTMDVIGKEETF